MKWAGVLRGVLLLACAIMPTASFRTPALCTPAMPSAALASRLGCNRAMYCHTQRVAAPLYTVRASASVGSASTPAAETRLLDLVQATKGRGQSATQTQLKQIQEAIAELEAAGGEPNPVSSPLICSSWELLYTSKSKFDMRNPLGKRVDGSKPGIEGLFGALFGEDSKTAKALTDAASSSPIQRTVTSIDGLIVSQDIVLSGRDPRVDQRVTFNKDAYLRLSASASTSPDSTSRIDFTFDLAYFQLGPLRVPYPVPFRLLGDEAKGWLDTTYLSSQLRISRGNKGTTFILRRLPTAAYPEP